MFKDSRLIFLDCLQTKLIWEIWTIRSFNHQDDQLYTLTNHQLYALNYHNYPFLSLASTSSLNSFMMAVDEASKHSDQPHKLASDKPWNTSSHRTRNPSLTILSCTSRYKGVMGRFTLGIIATFDHRAHVSRSRKEDH